MSLRDILLHTEGFLLDLDGTLYVGDSLLPGAEHFLALLREKNIPFLFLTNNSSRSTAGYAEKLRSRGIEASEEDVLTSGGATIRYLKNETPFRKIYLVGTPELEEEFTAAGFTLTFDGAEAVVLGYDTTVTYEKLAKAGLLIRAGLPYFATHADRTCIYPEGLHPDTGFLIAGYEHIFGRLPVVLGKPELPMIQAATERLGISDTSRIAMVGDQLDTDQTMALRHGLSGILVMSGETDTRALEAWGHQPAAVVEGIWEILDTLRKIYH